MDSGVFALALRRVLSLWTPRCRYTWPALLRSELVDATTIRLHPQRWRSTINQLTIQPIKQTPYRRGTWIENEVNRAFHERWLRVCCDGRCANTYSEYLNLDTTVKLKSIPDDLLALMAEKFRMLSDPTRLAILRCLVERQELNVSQLVTLSGRELANVSKHLKQMASTGLVTRRKQGSFALYRLQDPVLEKICELVCESLRRELEAEVRRNKRLLKKGALQ